MKIPEFFLTKKKKYESRKSPIPYFILAYVWPASKINVTPKGVYLPISKLHSILAVVNLLAHNNKSEICYCGQISSKSGAVFLTI